MALPVNFDPNAAIRIYNAVRKVEAGDRDQRPLTFERAFSDSQPKSFKLCRFTGSWQTATSKVITLEGNSAATLSATNLFFPITATVSESQCAVAKMQGTWILVSVPLQTATAVAVAATATAIVVSSVSTSTVSFVSGVTCSVTAETSQSSVVVGISAVLDTVTCDIGITLQTSSISLVSSVSTASTVSTATITFVSSVATSTSIISESTSLIQFLKIKDS